MPKYNRYVMPLFSDTHGGHTLGLLNPETIIKEYDQEGNEYILELSLSRTQSFLWELYTKHIKELEYIAQNDDIFPFFLGDLSNGNKYKDQLVFSSIYGQLAVAYYNLLPMARLKNVKRMRLAWGTSSHIFGEATTPRVVEDRLRENFPKKDIKGVPHGLLDINGLVIDYAHHGPGKGKRNWLAGNEFRYYLKSMQADEIDCGHHPPDLVARAHNHVRHEEIVYKFANGMKYTTHGILVPSYDLMSDFARQVTHSKSRVTNGMAVVEVINGKIHYVHWLTKTSDIRVKEKIK